MRKREILKVTPAEGRRFLQCEAEFEMIYDKLAAQSRWNTEHEVVLRRIKDDKYFISYYTIGSTEAQEQVPYSDGDFAIFQEVMPVEKKVIVYEWKPSKNP